MRKKQPDYSPEAKRSETLHTETEYLIRMRTFLNKRTGNVRYGFDGSYAVSMPNVKPHVQPFINPVGLAEHLASLRPEPFPVSQSVPPSHVRMQNDKIFLIEVPPTTRLLSYRNNDTNAGRASVYAIPMPWTYFVVQFANVTGPSLAMRHFMTAEPVVKLDDPLGMTFLPNVHVDGDICMYFNYGRLRTALWGDERILDPDKFDIYRGIDEAIALFYNQTFNNDHYT